MIALASVLIGYFVGRYVVNERAIRQNHEDIQNIKMIAESLNLMKKVKLYGVEAVVDNAKFQGYTLLSEMLGKHV